MSEFIYVCENPSMPGLVKIGRTERSALERISELSSHTGVPTDFVLVREYAVTNSVEAERRIHDRLADCRIADNREFFRIEVEDALNVIEAILGTSEAETRRDFDWEDELVARAIPIVVQQGLARPRQLEEKLGISYEEAVIVIHILRGRGVIDERNQSKWGTSSGQPATSQESRPSVTSVPLIGNYQLPPLDFLRCPDQTAATTTREELMATARLIQSTLAKRNLEVSIGDITHARTITRYELHLAPGIKFDDFLPCPDQTERFIAVKPVNVALAEALHVERLDIIAPIPGTTIVAVDVPHAAKGNVIMRDLFESEEWRCTKAKLPIAFGKDILGHPIIADLSRMPHLFMAGKVGSGKSVCVHGIVASLLYRFSPDQVRFVMIDPTNVELQQYNALPHLVMPLVENSILATHALCWVVNEMETRYKIFARVGASNLNVFNNRTKDEPPLVPREKDVAIPEKLSYIIVIIENLEAVMQVCEADVERWLGHIILNGHAAGIHLVLTSRQAGQNAISENNKACIAARIAFLCESRMESRSIIGEAGAEKLNGKGDMLYLPPGSAKPIRTQCAFITDQEISSIVEFIARQGKPGYATEMYQQLSNHDSEGGIDEDEEIIQQCIEVIRSEQKASVSLLQRRLLLGYTRAARIMDELEGRGIVGPSKGAEPRDILIDLDELVTRKKKPPVLPVAQPKRYVVCACEHCGNNIEFDASGIEIDEARAVECPHCHKETLIYVQRQLCKQCGREFERDREDEFCPDCREQNGGDDLDSLLDGDFPG